MVPTPQQLEARKIWIKGLRSGEYKQCTGNLEVETPNDGLMHCCLGVACREAIKHGIQLKVEPKTYKAGRDRWATGFNGWTGELPKEVAEWLGVSWRGAIPNPVGGYWSLTLLNDSAEAPFDEIAKIIEDQLVKPFDKEIVNGP